MVRIFLFGLAFILCAATGHAEVVQFKNGDQLTGTWQRVDESKLMFKAEVIGDVAIPVGKVKSFTSDKNVVVLTKSGERLEGALSLMETGEWEVTQDGETRRVTAATVAAIYPLEVYRPKGRERRVRPWHNWQGKGNLGYSLVHGDRDAATLSVGINATRLQPNLPGLKERQRTNYFLTMLFASTRTNDLRTSANSISSGLRQDFLFTPTNFFFVLAQLDHIQTQSLDLRQTYGGGLGHDVIRSSRVALNLLGGMTLVKERFQTEERRQSGEGLIGERLSLKLFDQMSLEHRLNFFPNLTEHGEFRIDTTSTFSAQISSRLSFNTTFTSRYLSNPLPGRQKNEMVLTTGVGVNF